VTLRALSRVCARWLKCATTSFIIGWKLRARFAQHPTQTYWPLIRDDWAKTFHGYSCVESLFFTEWFDDALRTLPRQNEGLYLLENQSWEKALARAWHKHGHGRLTAVAHSTVRFWDLRYHCDPREYEPGRRHETPGPDAVALNGPAACEQYLATCCNREPIVECEALRYLHLNVATSSSADKRAQDGQFVLLVLGDYARSRTDRLLQLVEAARRDSKLSIRVCVKAHPACPVDLGEYLHSEFSLVDDSVAALVPAADLILASNTTSAAVEAYVCGGRVVIHQDCEGVNLSPLRDVKGVRFVRGHRELIEALESRQASEHSRAVLAQRLLNIHAGLPRWRRYFDVAGAKETTG
jgi:surface carbohydrate biosynthesis protein (TIGR04326 family)